VHLAARQQFHVVFVTMRTERERERERERESERERGEREEMVFFGEATLS
jgi:hypothetical protein